jgi:hypothetical protein
MDSLTTPVQDVDSKAYPPERGDLIIRSADNVLFGVHRYTLESASPLWQDALREERKLIGEALIPTSSTLLTNAQRNYL